MWPYCSDVCQAAANPQPQRALCTVCSIAVFLWLYVSDVVVNPQVCQTNPQHVDTNTGKVYAYCSQECRAAEAASQQAQYSQPQQGTPPFPLYYPHLAHGFPSNSNVQLPWLHTLCCSVSSRYQLELLRSIPRIVCQHITVTLRAS